LREIAPRLARVALLVNSGSPSAAEYTRGFEGAAAKLGITAVVLNVRDPKEIEPAIAAFAREGDGGLVVPPDVVFGANRQMIIAAAARHRLPTTYHARYYVADGGLLSYGVDYNDLLRRAASYLDRILKGEKPADLPVQAPTKFEFVVNRKVANALGLEVPTSILLRADEVIE